jgi:hypothetical protein
MAISVAIAGVFSWSLARWFAPVALLFVGWAIARDRYELVLRSESLELRSLLRHRTVPLRSVDAVELWAARGHRALVLSTTDGNVHVSLRLPGLAAAVAAIRNAQPSVVIASRVYKYLRL